MHKFKPIPNHTNTYQFVNRFSFQNKLVGPDPIHLLSNLTENPYYSVFLLPSFQKKNF